MRIDSHHHLWRYEPREYAWIDENMGVLRRDYLAEELEAETARAGIGATIAVQARQSLEETRWLLEVAGAHPMIRGVVGWVPLIEEGVADALAELSSNPKLRGVRHVLQDEPDDAYMLREDFNRGIRSLEHFGLVYDVLIYARQLADTIRFVNRHPDQPFVLDHIAKPAISRSSFDEPWAGLIRELARREHVSCKLSGLVTEVRDPDWTLDMFKPYFETALDAFGPDRLMFGTDWPVCRLRCDYGRWVTAVEELMHGLSPDARDRIMGRTALRIYG